MEINLYRSLECDNYELINQQIIDHINTLGIIETTNNFWNPIDVVGLLKSAPLFLQWTVNQNLKIKAVAVTVGQKLDCCGIHVDTPPARYKLSWPVLNTKQSYNRWFKEVGPCDTVTNELGGKTYLSLSGLEEISKRILDAPAIIDAGIPHDVQFYTTDPVFPRIGLQCQLINEPEKL
jgi:hypothetical protein